VEDDELVVLVDEFNTSLGTKPKTEVHTASTPMHRAFSLFIFNPQGELLLQQRALSKKTWPGIWSNSVCGHPLPDETFIMAGQRRTQYELGIDLQADELHTILPDYSYRYEHKGVVENEFCPVLVAFTTQNPQINQDEVADWRWMLWQDFLLAIAEPNDFTEWCVEEATLLSRDSQFQALYQKGTYASH